MKRFLRMAASAAFVLLLSACARHKIIPDDTLAQIFHDAFLTNAYIGSEGVKTDSLRIYEPIFARYGYTTDDVHYTIGNFSKRKSARLGDVVERAIEMLEREGKIYNQEVAVLDTIDNVARRTFTRTVLADSLIRVGSLRDTARLSFTLDVEPGEYSLSLKYLVDSLDRNQRGLKGSVWLERRDSSRTNVYTTTLRRNREESFSRRFTTDTTHRRLRIDFLTFNARPERPSVTVTDLKVEYIPPTRTAVEKLYEQQLDIRIFADDFLRAAAIPKAERLRVARTARQLAHQRLHHDPAAQPRGELLAPVYDRHDAPPPAHRLPDLQRQARTAFGDGHRPQGGVHSPDPHGRRKTLRTATRHPDFRR